MQWTLEQKDGTYWKFRTAKRDRSSRVKSSQKSFNRSRGKNSADTAATEFVTQAINIIVKNITIQEKITKLPSPPMGGPRRSSWVITIRINYEEEPNCCRLLRCTTSSPRATYGPRRVVMWPAMASREATICHNIWMILIWKCKAKTNLVIISSIKFQHSSQCRYWLNSE